MDIGVGEHKFLILHRTLFRLNIDQAGHQDTVDLLFLGIADDVLHLQPPVHGKCADACRHALDPARP